MLNITAVMTAIINLFHAALDWLQTHGITIGGKSISFFTLAVVFLIIGVLLSALLPWYDEEDD